MTAPSPSDEIQEIDKQIDRLSRAHADACRAHDDEMARILASMIGRHCRNRHALSVKEQSK